MNGFAHHLVFFDTFVYLLGNNLLKGGVVVALLWWAWFRVDGKQIENRQYLLCGIVACLLSIVVARAMCGHTSLLRKVRCEIRGCIFNCLWRRYRGRSMHWSVFPSDHVASLSLGEPQYFSRGEPRGSLFLSCRVLPYLPATHLSGVHHPTDILAARLSGSASLPGPQRESSRASGLASSDAVAEEALSGKLYACLFLRLFNCDAVAEVRDIGQYSAEHLSSSGREHRRRRIKASAVS